MGTPRLLRAARPPLCRLTCWCALVKGGRRARQAVAGAEGPCPVRPLPEPGPSVVVTASDAIATPSRASEAPSVQVTDETSPLARAHAESAAGPSRRGRPAGVRRGRGATRAARGSAESTASLTHATTNSDVDRATAVRAWSPTEAGETAVAAGRQPTSSPGSSPTPEASELAATGTTTVATTTPAAAGPPPPDAVSDLHLHRLPATLHTSGQVVCALAISDPVRFIYTAGRVC